MQAEEVQRVIGRSAYEATKIELAEFFGVQIETLDLWRRKGMPYTAAPIQNHKNTYDIRATAQWLAGKRTLPGSDDSAEVGFREEKRRTAELQRLRLEGKLVDVEVYEDRVLAAIQKIRVGTEKMHREFGEAAAILLSQICDEAERMITKGEDIEQEDADL